MAFISSYKSKSHVTAYAIGCLPNSPCPLFPAGLISFFKLEFLNLGTIGTLGKTVVHCRNCLHCRMFGSIPHLYLLCACGTSTPSGHITKCSQTFLLKKPSSFPLPWSFTLSFPLCELITPIFELYDWFLSLLSQLSCVYLLREAISNQ